MIKKFWNSLSIMDKDLLWNALWSTLVSTYTSIVYDHRFLTSWFIVFSVMYILNTIGYFRKYLTDDRRYTINIDNTQNADYLCHDITLNLLNKKGEVSQSTTFSSPKNNDDGQQNKTDGV